MTYDLEVLDPEEHNRYQTLARISLLPTSAGRVEALKSFGSSDATVILKLVEALSKDPNLRNRSPLLDMCRHLISIGRLELLQSLLERNLSDPSVPLRNLVWVSLELKLQIPEKCELRLFTSSDPETIIPYLLSIHRRGKWSNVTESLFRPHQNERVQLWTEYLACVNGSKTTRSAPLFPLLELARLDDLEVFEWVNRELRAQRYDSDILKVCIEHPDANRHEILWQAIWKRPKHQALAIDALVVNAPHYQDSTESLFRRSLQATTRQARKRYARLLARRATKVIFHQACSFCTSIDPNARILGIEILTYFGSPWHSARSACTEELLRCLNDSQLRVRRAAVHGLAVTERKKMNRYNNVEPIPAQEMTQLSRAWEGLAQNAPHASHRKNHNRRVRAKTSRSGLPSGAPVLALDMTRHVSSLLELKPSDLKIDFLERKYSMNRVFRRAASGLVMAILFIGIHQLNMSPQVALVTSQHSTEDFNRSENTGMNRTQPSQTMVSFPFEASATTTLQNRSDTWYLYYRLQPDIAARYLVRAPVPSGPTDSHWSLYQNQLLRHVRKDIDNYQFSRAGPLLASLYHHHSTLAEALMAQVLKHSNQKQRLIIYQSIFKHFCIS